MPIPSFLFRLHGALEKRLDYLMRVASFPEHLTYGLGYGHLDIVQTREIGHGLSGDGALGDHLHLLLESR